MSTERQIVRDLAGFVVTELAALGRTFVPDTDERLAEHRGVYLDEPSTGARIFLSCVQGNTDRVQVSGIYPQNRLYKVERFAATTARDRGPQAVAKAITGRILPGYLAELARIRESNDEDVVMRAERAALVERLGLAEGAVDNKGTRADFPLRVNGTWGEGYVSYRADSVDLHLRSLTPEQALAVARVLKENR